MPGVKTKGFNLEVVLLNKASNPAKYKTIINVTAGNVVRLLPTLNITQEQADQLIERLVKMINAFLA